MGEELCIFLSHKLGDSERNARTVAGSLALFGGPNVKVICSANFERGVEWEPKIREGLAKAHWLILLYTGPNVEWDWCLYETGFFRALMEDGKSGKSDRRLICLHDPAHPVPAPLRGLTSVPAHEDKVMGLFEEIYLNEPWKLNPAIFRDNPGAVEDTVRRVCEACRFGTGPKYNLQIAPSIHIRVKESEVHNLEEGAIPPTSPVTGEGIWETVFGKPEGTAGWTWRELTEGVVHISAWEYQLSAMMAEAIKRRSVQYPSIAIRVSIGDDARSDIYRIGLRRVSEYEDGFEFVFVLSQIRSPFEPAEDDRETMLYHLFNLAWHFRRRFIEHHKRKMEALADSQDSYQRSGRRDEFTSELDDAVRSISIDLKALEADAQVRGLDRTVQIRRAFPLTEQQKLDQLLNVDFPPLIKRLNEALGSPSPQPRDIHAILVEMDPINKWFYEKSLKELNRGQPRRLKATA
jgi:hypothetical protein